MAPSRLLASLLAAAFFLAGASHAQEPPKEVSESCKDLQDASAQEIDRRIATLRVRSQSSRRTAEDPAGSTEELTKKIRESQEGLMDLIFSRECLRRDLESEGVLAQKVQSRMGLRAPPAWVTITTFYATNRTATGESDGVTSYGPDRAAQVNYGRAEVSIFRPRGVPASFLFRVFGIWNSPPIPRSISS